MDFTIPSFPSVVCSNYPYTPANSFYQCSSSTFTIYSDSSCKATILSVGKGGCIPLAKPDYTDSSSYKYTYSAGSNFTVKKYFYFIVSLVTISIVYVM